MDFEKLYAPYSERASLEETVAWLTRECKSRGVSNQAREQALLNTFVEIENGKVFSLTGEGTGFEGIPHAALNHYLLKTAININKEYDRAYLKALQDNFNKTLKKAKKSRWTNWYRSPVLRLFGYNKVK